MEITYKNTINLPGSDKTIYRLTTELFNTFNTANYALDISQFNNVFGGSIITYYDQVNDTEYSGDTSPFTYQKYNVSGDELPIRAGYTEIGRWMSNATKNQEFRQKQTMLDYFHNYVWSDFLAGYVGSDAYIAPQKCEWSTDKKTVTLQNNDPIRFVYVENPPNDLRAYLVIKDFYFEMRKVQEKRYYALGAVIFQYPAYLIEQFPDMYDLMTKVELVSSTAIETGQFIGVVSDSAKLPTSFLRDGSSFAESTTNIFHEVIINKP